MKRIFSKRSGFTLVEILVAFAIFAIMSTMILSMVQLTVEQRNVNNQLANNIINDNEYLAGHYINETDEFDTGDAVSGRFKLNFGDTTDVVAEMDYQIRSNPSYTNEAGGINYFVGDTKYTGVEEIENDENDPIEGFGNQQDSRYETWISGTRGLDYVKIWDVVKDTTYTGTGVRYFIKCSASSAGVDSEYVPYTQYRISFKMPTYKTVERKEDDGKTYEYKIKYNAEILDYGYNNGENLVWSSDCVSHTNWIVKKPSDGTYRANQYLVEKTSPHTLHFTSPFRTDGGYALEGSQFSSVWVVFKEDPQLTVSSFGANGVVDGSGLKFTNFPIYNDDGSESGEYNLNIYGAHKLQRTLVASS